ncbi:MAG TPA: HD domain-containing protein [Ktedonobacteraceae bacterium]|jgi:HD superfamily phosphodiesterase|nr:HD domain-containing protein [Ktedonobacteraceae bacterium]
MDTEVVQAVLHYAEEVLGEEGFRYVSAVVANCKMLALQLEAEEEPPSIQMETLVISAYLHDISTIAHGFHDHQHKSAEMAGEFLRSHHASDELLAGVEQILLAHTMAMPPEQRESAPIEAKILFDADKLGRLSGLAVVTSLIEFGARYPNREVTGEVLAAILRHIEERFIELYQSLNTPPARDLAREKFHNTLAFLDGVIEHLSDATPV